MSLPSRGHSVARTLAVAAAVALAIAAVAWSQRGSRQRDDRPNLLMVVIDSARRGHLGLYGYRRPTSPFLDALGGGGRVYDHAFSASSWTVPSVARLLNPSPRLPAAIMPLQAALGGHGYRTGCFTDNALIGQNPLLVAGFELAERSRGRWPGQTLSPLDGEVPALDLEDPDRRVVDKASTWARQSDRPVFLYVHLMGAHYPFRRPPIDGRVRRGRHIDFPPGSPPSPTPAEIEDIVARYDGGLRQADANVRRLLDAAARWGRPFVAIVTADHGESLGDDGRWRHGGSLAPELLAVPLVVAGAGVTPGRVHRPVGASSLSRTLIAAAGFPCEGCTGVDLRSGDGADYAQGWLPPHRYYRVRGHFKLVVDLRDESNHLYDLDRDALEHEDVAALHPDVVAELRRELEQTKLLADPFWFDADARLSDQLRALGYVAGHAEPPPTPTVSPR